MNTYIATFYSHFGAVRFVKELKKSGIAGKTMPVPRSLSSSCGTCVEFETDNYTVKSINDEIEKIVIITPNGYDNIYLAENS